MSDERDRDHEEINLSGKGVGPGTELRQILEAHGIVPATGVVSREQLVITVFGQSPTPPVVEMAIVTYATEDMRAFGVSRSPGWREFERDHLKRNPRCAVTGATEGVVGHHIIPYHVNPNKELDEDNLITLAPFPHLLVGHLMNWKSFNADVRNTSRLLNAMINTRPMPAVKAES